MHDAAFLDYLRSWGKSKPLVSVCTGSLVLGAAGYLKGKRATTHHLAFDLLAPLCKEVVTDERIVEDGHVTTAGGVTSALDLGLHLVERYWGDEARARVAEVMEYRG
jgi:cyclohexyl-isocyanide hydratase